MNGSVSGTRRQHDRVDCCFSRGRVLLLTVTEACNQRCLHCMRSAGPRPVRRVDLELLSQAIPQAVAEVRPDRIIVSGGEPTLVPNILDLLRLLSSTGLAITLCTNATTIDVVGARALANAGATRATVGIEALDEAYDTFRGCRGMFGLARRGILALGSVGIEVTVNITLHADVIHTGRAFGEYLGPLPLTKICVTSPIVAGRLTTNAGAVISMSEHLVQEFVEDISRVAPFPVVLRIPRCDRRTCPSGKRVFAIDETGRLQPCPDVGSRNAVDL